MTIQSTLTPINGDDLQLSVSTSSARTGPFTENDVSFYCATECWIKFGDSTVTASTSSYDIMVPALTMLDMRNGGNSYMAVISSGSDTAYINEWTKKAS